MKIKDIVIRVFKKGYRILLNKKFTNPQSDANRQSVNDKIYNLLVADKPCMISRFGTTELISINNYLCISNDAPYYKKIWHYISDNTHTPWWFEEHFKFLEVYSGVFPATQETSERFSKRYLDDIPSIDLLGSFQYYEKFMPLRDDVQNAHLETLYPFFVDKPWTRALKGKKVLIIHPFEETILRQYSINKQLFEHPDVLPDFDLIIIKAIQSAASIEVPYKDWFEALQAMENQISAIDFDICILGCGAYGLPLAAHVKRMGKKAIHLGGGTQLLFGIKGKRWDNPLYGQEYNDAELFKNPYSSLYNEYWTKPLSIDTPSTAKKVDDACYW